jgi:hypothetical protein
MGHRGLLARPLAAACGRLTPARVGSLPNGGGQGQGLSSPPGVTRGGLVKQQWPEGPNADPDAARERYRADMQTSQGSMQNLFRVERGIAHMGLVIAIIASVFVGVVWSPRTGAIIAGAFAALFIVALAAAILAGSRGWGAARAAYKFTFGWADWLTP